MIVLILDLVGSIQVKYEVLRNHKRGTVLEGDD